MNRSSRGQKKKRDEEFYVASLHAVKTNAVTNPGEGRREGEMGVGRGRREGEGGRGTRDGKERDGKEIGGEEEEG